jgi:hypothetical protein
MSYFLGSAGNVRLRRNAEVSYASIVKNEDVNTVLNRFSFDGSLENILTGDRLDISTTDPRGLAFFAPAAWTSNTVENSITTSVNVNAAGGLRCFPTFAPSVNNTRAVEYALQSFEGGPLPIDIRVRDVSLTTLGDVTGYTFNTDRDALSVTTLSDKFKKMLAAGMISGSGTIDCIFNHETTGLKETPLLMLQLINRVDIGSQFDCALKLVDGDLGGGEQSVYYEFSAVVTRSGVQVTSTKLIECAIDFVTTGEIRLLVGEPSGYVLKEDDDRIYLERDLGFLLTDVGD